MAGFTPSTPASFILKEGPHESRGSKTVKQFIVKYNLPAYKCCGQGTQDEQLDGRDPVLEVEAVTGKVGRGNKTKYWVKWKGHKAKTLEPKSHLKDCPDLVKQFEDGINKARADPRPSRATATIAVGEDRGSGDMMVSDDT